MTTNEMNQMIYDLEGELERLTDLSHLGCGDHSLTPYFEDAESGITIYHADCRDILPSLEGVDLFLIDPPYGVSGILNTRNAQRKAGKKNNYGTFTDSIDYVMDIVLPMIEGLISTGRRCIITPGNRAVTMYPPPDSFGCFYQPASTGLQPWGRADAQPILYYGRSPHGGRRLPGIVCSHVLTEAPSTNAHPCAKPMIAWSRLLCAGSKKGDLVCDPFLGSGTTLVACKKLGRRGIGIEIEERYCEIAARRIMATPRSLFAEPPPPAEQGRLFAP